jgi:hypothetical protein
VYDVHLKNGYSDRKNITSFKECIQYKELNIRTRNKIYDCILENIEKSAGVYRTKKYPGNIEHYIYQELFSLSQDEIPYQYNIYGAASIDYGVFNHHIKEIVINADYSKVFTFIEGIIRYDTVWTSSFINEINSIFKEELVEHIIINGQVTDITDEIEISEVQRSIDYADKSAEHICNAIRLLYNRDEPRPKNSINEAMQAIEARCIKITGQSHATLGEALNKLKSNGIELHPSFIMVLNKLYGYTSDAKGIRHAGGLDSAAGENEAQLILVLTAAFCNYLKKFEK